MTEPKDTTKTPKICFACGMIEFSVLPGGAMNADIRLYHEQEEWRMEPKEVGSLIRWLLDNYTAPMKTRKGK